MAHVLQGRVGVVEGWGVVLLLDVVWHQVGEAAREEEPGVNVTACSGSQKNDI